MGNTQWACIEIATGRPKRMSPTFTQAYQPLAADIKIQWTFSSTMLMDMTGEHTELCVQH